MKENIRDRGAEILKCEKDEVFDQLEKIADKITNKDSVLFQKCLNVLNRLIDEFKELENYRNDIADAVLRYMRTPSFLVRFAASVETEYEEGWLEKSFEKTDYSGITLIGMIKTFLVFLNNRREDREDYITYLKTVQPGGIRVKDVAPEELDEEENTDQKDNTIMANVRLCYGATKKETRQKLMKTFNTPFFPDILVTSNVMAEGVDLHLNCSMRPLTRTAYERMFPAPRQRWVDAMAHAEADVRAIQHPTLMVHGRDDKVIPLSTSMTLLEWIEDSQLHIFGRCGHWTQIEHAVAFSRLVANFLAAGNASAA